MKPQSLPILLYCGLLLLGACHSNRSSTSARYSGGGSPRIDSSRSAALQAANRPLEARDSTREASNENYDTLDPSTRSHFRDVQAFLDFIKRTDSDYNVGFNRWIKNFRIGNIDSFLNFIATDSLEIDDADADPGKDSLNYSRNMLRQQITRRKGAAFDMFGAISLHYSDPYPQYSHTTFSIDKKDSVPNLKVTFSEFVLYFRAEKGCAVYKLYRLESDHISDL
jgi:hypothetical protein